LGAPLTNITEAYEYPLEDITGASEDTDKWAAVDERRWTMTQEGFVNIGVNQYHQILETADPQILMYARAGNTIGAPLVAFFGVRTVYETSPARGEHHKARATYLTAATATNQAPTPPGKTRIIANLIARTTAGPANTVSHDWGVGSTSTNGGSAWISMTAVTLGGATAVAVKIRDSDDNVTFVDLATFTPRTTIGAERIAIAGTIERYVLTQWEFTGSPGGSQTATFTTGLSRY
jgi:hypothetical protein